VNLILFAYAYAHCFSYNDRLDDVPDTNAVTPHIPLECFYKLLREPQYLASTYKDLVNLP
jgi:hypothetical protein